MTPCSLLDNVTTMAIGGLIGLIIYFVLFRKRAKNFPPGPYGIPLLGYAPFLGKNPGKTMMELKETYGCVMSVKVGRENWVVLNDYETIHEAFVRQSEKFSGRPDNYLFTMITHGYGLLGADYGPTWKSLRKFGSVTLRGFGVGKKGMETNIIEELSYLLKNLANNDSNTTFRRKFEMAISNIVSGIAFGSRFDYEDKKFLTMLEATADIFTDPKKAKAFAAIVFAPAFRYFPGIRGTVNAVLEANQLTLNLLQEILDEHKASYVEGETRDFIDAFMKEMKQREGQDPSFNDKHLLQYIRDLFQAGTATTASTLHWSIFTFCHFPETQEKMANEIEKVIGYSATPTMSHREQMPYTCAFIHEVMRLKTLAPLGLIHQTNQNAILSDYNIPKNTTVAANFWAVHHDPKTFPNPDCFFPERFFDNNGNFVSSSHVIPFSVGPRHCIGQQLARMELFLFLTSIVQKFKIVPDTRFKLPAYEDFCPIIAISHEAPEFEVVFVNR